MSKDKVKRILGVEMAHWKDALRSCLVELGSMKVVR